MREGRRKVKRREVEQQTMEYLRQRKFKEASMAVAAYEAKQKSPRGMGMNWEQYDCTRDVDALNVIFGQTPKILGKLDEGQLGPLRLAAGMAHLWGTNEFEKWLPPGFTTGLRMDNDTAARMLLFLGINKATIAGYRRSGVVREVEILATGDSCEDCVKLASGSYTLDEVPELPYEHCTSEMGCRCCFAPVIRR